LFSLSLADPESAVLRNPRVVALPELKAFLLTSKKMADAEVGAECTTKNRNDSGMANAKNNPLFISICLVFDFSKAIKVLRP